MVRAAGIPEMLAFDPDSQREKLLEASAQMTKDCQADNEAILLIIQENNKTFNEQLKAIE
jgi:hypothetical protein